MTDSPRLVHVIDDEEGIRRSLRFLLSKAGYSVECWDGGAAFLGGAEKLGRACVILDLRMPGMNGLELQHEMKREGFNFPVIVLTGHGDVPMAVSAMRAGASDFIQKPIEREKLLEAIETAFAMGARRDRQLSDETWARGQLAHLTAREQEVLHGLACGFPNKTIAYDLGISARTVEVYRANVMTKLEVHNFADALRIAFAAGLGSMDDWEADHQIGRIGPDAGRSSSGNSCIAGPGTP